MGQTRELVSEHELRELLELRDEVNEAGPYEFELRFPALDALLRRYDDRTARRLHAKARDDAQVWCGRCGWHRATHGIGQTCPPASPVVRGGQ